MGSDELIANLFRIWNFIFSYIPVLQIKGGCSIIYMNIEEIWGKK
jgi:hypothetical protein